MGRTLSWHVGVRPGSRSRIHRTFTSRCASHPACYCSACPCKNKSGCLPYPRLHRQNQQSSASDRQALFRGCVSAVCSCVVGEQMNRAWKVTGLGVLPLAARHALLDLDVLRQKVEPVKYNYTRDTVPWDEVKALMEKDIKRDDDY
eukprot:m.750446 g.750446  ORF g.750446 m.750446 type:complete len:146 (-) comp23157_c0_seq18:395-832(-)